MTKKIQEKVCGFVHSWERFQWISLCSHDPVQNHTQLTGGGVTYMQNSTLAISTVF